MVYELQIKQLFLFIGIIDFIFSKNLKLFII